MTPDDVRAADAIEAAAFRDMYAAAPREFAAQLGIVARDVGGATLLVARGVPDPVLNRAIGLGVTRAAAESDLEAVISAYRAAGVKSWWVHLTPGAEPAALRGWLERRGFALAKRNAWAKMLRGAQPAPAVETPLEVRAARAGEHTALAESICAAYGMPAAFVPWFAALPARAGWRASVALEAGQVVGGGLLYLAGREAWLGAGGVRAEQRGKHAHRALMALRVGEAIAAGCRRIFTETGEPVGDEPNPSLANMQWCGFRRLASRLNYAAPAAA
jgi:hypothetical protein